MACLQSTSAVLFCVTGCVGIGFYIYLLGFELTYNEILTQSSSNWFDVSQDVPLTLAVGEIVVCFIALVFGASTVGIEKGRCLFYLYGFGGIIFGAVHGFIFYTRLVNVGTVEGIVSLTDVGIDAAKQTCVDTTMTGCPTTRRSVDDGSCSFWYWDTQPSAAQLLNENKTFVYDDVINYMNWDVASSYGYRTIDTVNTNIVTVDPDQESTMKKLLEIQTYLQSTDNQATYGITIQTEIDDANPPTLAYCWYWGCDKTCMPSRHRTNQAMLYASFSLTVLFLLSGITSICASQFPNDGRGSGGGGGGGFALANNNSNAVRIGNTANFVPYKDQPLTF